MASRIADLRDAIVAHIGAGSYSASVTAEGVYQPTVTLEGMSAGDVHVFVRPAAGDAPAQPIEFTTRGKLPRAITYHAIVTGKLNSDDVAGVDELLGVAEEIEARLHAQSAQSLTYRVGEDAQWTGAVLNPIADEDNIVTSGIAMFVIEVQYLYEKPR